MTQPHNIDREAVKTRLASILIDLTNPDEPCPSEADIARAIIDAMIALSAPTEAVAALSSRPVDDTGGEFSGANPEAADRWADLERLAVAATAGERFWALDGHNQATSLMTSGAGDYVISPQVDVGDYALSMDCWIDAREDDLAFFAAANPATVLELIAAARAATNGEART